MVVKKWNRIKEPLPDLQGRKIADIGCNNDYFMFRMAAQKPAEICWFEPYAKNWLIFSTTALCQIAPFKFELLGVGIVIFLNILIRSCV